MPTVDATATVAVVGAEDAPLPVPVTGRFYIGRECADIEPSQRLIVDDPKVSRVHLEIHVDERGAAAAQDLSTNGTLLNGLRMERAVPTPLGDRDRLRLGDTLVEYRSTHAPPPTVPRPRTTVVAGGRMRMVLVAGDIIGSTTLAEASSSEQVAEVAQQLFTALGDRLATHRGTLSHLAGDALLAVWDLGHDEEGADRAVAFAVEAAGLVARTAPGLPLRNPDGTPVRMGWGVALGEVALSHLARGRSTVLGDPANVAFRLADAAGRDGRPEVLVTAEVAELVRRPLAIGPSAPLSVKGRRTPVHVRAVQPRD